MNKERSLNLAGPRAQVRGCWVVDLLLGKE